jgi:hypothetical protein
MALNQPLTALFVKLIAPEEISFMYYFILTMPDCKIDSPSRFPGTASMLNPEIPMPAIHFHELR